MLILAERRAEERSVEVKGNSRDLAWVPCAKWHDRATARLQQAVARDLAWVTHARRHGRASTKFRYKSYFRDYVSGGFLLGLFRV